MPDDSSGFQAKVYALVRRIPAGKVASYGWIASALGHARRARMVGQALARLPANSGVPWHRVVNAQRRISVRDWEAHDMQRQFLEAEGVRFEGDAVRRECVIRDVSELVSPP